MFANLKLKTQYFAAPILAHNARHMPSHALIRAQGIYPCSEPIAAITGSFRDR